MGDSDSPSTPSSSHSPSPRSNLPMIYYGLVVVGTAALVLVVYNLIIVRWCANQYRRSPEQGLIRTMHDASSQARTSYRNRNRNRNSNPDSSNISLGSSFKYKKGGETKHKLAYDTECSVCLSGFEEGEEVKQLPTCKHSFHAPCIDMWLYSHADCPVCRAKVVPPIPIPHRQNNAPPPPAERSREVLLDLSTTPSVIVGLSDVRV